MISCALSSNHSWTHPEQVVYYLVLLPFPWYQKTSSLELTQKQNRVPALMPIEVLARRKDVEHNVKTSEMSSKMSRHRDNTNK